MSTSTLLIVVAVVVVIGGGITLAMLRLPMRRPAGTLRDREQWFAEARANRGEAPDDDEPLWDGVNRRPNLEGQSGAGLL